VTATIVRAQVMHTPGNPFRDQGAFQHWSDGAVAFADTVLAVGSFEEVRRQYPKAPVIDARDSVLLPGLIDVHVHYPQVHMIGAMGMTLLTWLKTRTLPEEANMVNDTYARVAAHNFVHSLLANGTTTALVFGAHFASAQAILFDEALRQGVRMTSGLVLSDRNLRPELETTPEQAHAQSQQLIDTYHRRDRLRYAVSPRFSLSCSDAILEVTHSLLTTQPDVWLQTHINENVDEIALVAELFPSARDYLDTYERHDLLTPRSVFAHNIHVSDSELSRLAASGAKVAHCPSSNMFIGSGIFDMNRHVSAGIPFSLGSDVAGGTGFSLFKEALMSYQGQMLRHEGYPLTAAHLLYLVTRAGANLLGYDDIGDLSVGKQADFMLVRPQPRSSLANVLAHSPSAEASLSAIVTLAREDCIAATYIAGEQRFVAEAAGATAISQQQ
jgi:guanine deaminase